MTMTTIEATDQLYENNIRIEQMWLFPMWFGGEEIADTLSIMIDKAEDFPPQLADLVKNWDEEMFDQLLDGSDGYDFSEALDELSVLGRNAGLAGFLGVVSTPVLHYTSASSASFSWGHTWHKLIFGETLEAFVANAITWADDMDAEAKAKWGPTSGSS